MSDTLIAFCGASVIAKGTPATVAQAAKARLAEAAATPVLVFDESSGRQVDLDYSSPGPETSPTAASPGRPKLGVIGREVTLLPRHWDWLGTQSGGASVALRKLVENAMRSSAESDARRNRQEACYRFITAIGGNLPGYEEALRSLFADSKEGFSQVTAQWPKDVSGFALQLGFAK